MQRCRRTRVTGACTLGPVEMGQSVDSKAVSLLACASLSSVPLSTGVCSSDLRERRSERWDVKPPSGSTGRLVQGEPCRRLPVERGWTWGGGAEDGEAESPPTAG